MGQSIDFEAIYQNEVVDAPRNDHQLDFKKENAKYFTEGVCPECGKRELFSSNLTAYRLECSRDKRCQFDEKTRERYSDLFENQMAIK